MNKNYKLKNRYLTRLFIYFHFLTLVSLSGVYAQSKRLDFIYLTPEEGLSSSIVYSILQDHKGFMWFGTADGLNRYDGFNFAVYRNSPGDSASISDNVINSIFEDHNKLLLIATEKGLCSYDRKMDRFKNYSIDRSSPLYGDYASISRLAEDPVGNLWLATQDGLTYFDRENNKIYHYRHDPDDPASISSNVVRGVLVDKAGSVWVTTRKGLNLFLNDKGSFIHFKKTPESNVDLSLEYLDDIIEDHTGNIWMGSANGVYCIIRNRKGVISKINHYQNDINDKTSLSINQISSLSEDRSGNIWIGTENGGINLFNKENESFWHYRKDEYDPESINNESIESIYQDRTGILWFGSFTGGLNIVRSNSDAIIKFQALPGAPMSLSHNTVTCFLEDHAGKIWIGTDGGGLNLFNDKTSRFSRYNITNSDLSSNAILCLYEDTNKSIWIGTWAGGLVRFDARTGIFESFNTQNSSIQDNNIYAIAPGTKNDLWLGTFENGLINYKIKEKKFITYTPENSGLSNAMVIKIAPYSKGRYFVGTANALQLFSPDDGKFINYISDNADPNTLSYPRVTDILVENDSSVWIGTPEGLNKLNPITGSFIRYFEKDGLPNNFIKGIAVSDSGDLWITTNKGVCLFDYKKRIFKNYTKADGFQSNEFSERSILRLKTGALLMGGVRGFNIVFTDKIVENTNIPEILITNLKIFNQSIKPGTKNSPLSENITETRTLTLKHDQTSLAFAFAAMDFSAPGKNQYAYKMENFDRDWIYPGNKGEVTYTSLNPGRYVFRVIGSNNDGLWNKAGTSLMINVLPPWWMTLWFKLIAVLSLIIILFLAYFTRIYQLKNQKILLEKSVEIKTAELKQLNASKDKFFSIIAHDLKNPFNTIIGFSEVLQEEINSGNFNKSKEYAGMLNSSAVHTLKLLENLLEWANSQRGKTVFQPLLINLSDLFVEEFNALTDMALRKNIELLNSLPANLIVTADKNMIKTILRNLISNSIKFTNRNGKIEVAANIEEHHIEISVSDNGIGMNDETISKLFRIDTSLTTSGTENEKGTGLGLFLCKEFVEKHGGNIWVESEPGKGSVFRFTLPSGNI